MSMPLIVAFIAVVVVIVAVSIYNNLVRSRKEVDNAWSQIDVQLKRRHDLIPNLVESVKGYAAHESGVLERVTQARTSAVSAGSQHEKMAAENALGGAVKGLMVQLEAYPELKANTNFLQLQEELTATENKISFARQHYNDSATSYNTAIALFPACIFAGMFRFTDIELWQIEDAAQREVPQVKF